MLNSSAVVLQPSTEQLEIVLRWLAKERCEISGLPTGFQQKEELIREQFDAGEMRCLVQDESVLGFATLRALKSGSGWIDLFEIWPEYRRLGWGRQFAMRLLELLVMQGVERVVLQCDIDERIATQFWESLGVKRKQVCGIYMEWRRS